MSTVTKRNFGFISAICCITTCVLLIYVSDIYNSLEHLQIATFDIDDEDHGDLSSNITNQTIDKMRKRDTRQDYNYEYIDKSWYTLFYCKVMVQHLTRFIKLEKVHHQDSSYLKFIDCDSININIHNLLSDTNIYFSITNKDIQSISSYHNQISLRRRIISLCQEYNISIMDDQNYKQILKYFSLSQEYHIETRQKNRYLPYFIHLSKSGGRSVQATLTKLLPKKLKHTFFSESQNLNCNQQYDQTSNTGYAIREDPLYGRGDNDEPCLCDNFIYLMPIREPIERICSQTWQILGTNLMDIDRQSLLIKYDNASDQFDNTESNCMSQQIIINNIPYKHISDLNEFKNIYVELLEPEIPFKVSSLEDVENRLKQTTFNGDELKDLWFDKKICSKLRLNSLKLQIIPFKVDHNKSTILQESKFIYMTTRSDYIIDNSWVRTKMGSNMYTSWLGYNYSIDRINSTPAPITFGNHVSRLDIKYEHFINSMNIMLQIDYVIPMETKVDLMLNKENEISTFAFQDVEYHFWKIFGIDRKYLNDWKVVHSSSTSAISSSKICEAITERDKDLLLKYNQYDIALYKISKWIKLADETFFKIYPTPGMNRSMANLRL